MPLESRNDDEGVLAMEEGFPVLLRDDGGRWRLHMSRRYRNLIGRRVYVTGVRDGFDWLTVERITLT